MEEKRETENTTEVGIGGNREYKDTLFRKIFGTEENRKYLLSLYNAINGSAYTNADELEIVTMEDVLFVSMKNDVAFILDCEMNLYEHQSTINYNMPVRGLLYSAKLLQDWLIKEKKNIYQKSLIKIPTPRYIVFYNGKEEMQDKSLLKLSDAFMKQAADGIYEWTAMVYNINCGRNKEIMEHCQALRQYADFVRMVRENSRIYPSLTEAIKAAMDEAIRKNYLDGYFEREKERIFMTVLYEVKRDVYEDGLREEGREEGRTEERIKILTKSINRLMEIQGLSYEQACDLLEIPAEEYDFYRQQIEKL